MAQIEVDDDVRDDLRVYKAKDGLTYTQAIEELLAIAEREQEQDPDQDGDGT